MKGLGRLLVLGCSLALGPGARAAELTAPDSVVSLELHGFVSQGFIKTSTNNYLASSERGSFEFNEVGVNFTSQLTEKLRIGLQLFARKLGSVGTYSAKTDWFYLDYRWRDWLGLRAGRVKLPFGLYNDTSDIDAARVPVLLPQSLYSLSSRDFLLAQSGAELYGYINLSSAGAVDYRIYGGTIFVDLPSQIGSPLQITQISNPYIVGGRLTWEPPVDGLRVGGSVQALRLDLPALSTATMPAGMATYRLSAVLWVASIEYSAHDVLVAAEYGRWHVDTETSDPTVLPVPGPPKVVSERGYVMAAYRLRPWFQPGVYYSVLFPNVAFRSRGPADMQLDAAGTLRFDINAHWLVKLEGHYVHGTADLQPALNKNIPQSMLAKDWAVFLIKTTAYF